VERQSLLLTDEVPGRSLERRVPDELERRLADRAFKARLGAELAGVVARLHAARLVHRDLYLSHVFIDEGADGTVRLSLIDLQRVLRPRLRWRRWMIKDLAALDYSTPRAAASRADRLRFWKRYRGAQRLGPGDKALIRAVARKSRRIARHTARRGLGRPPGSPDRPAPTPNQVVTGQRFTRFRVAGWRGRVDDRWRHVVAADPLEWLAGQPKETVWHRPSATTFRVDTDRGAAFVKHVTAPKDRAPRAADWPSRLWWRLQPSRALRVLRINREFARRGLLVAPVLAAARRRSGWRAEDLLVTGEVKGLSLHRAFVDAPDDETRRDLLRMAGRRVAELHRLRFIHGDLLPGNLVVTADGTNVVWLDNDRSRRWFPAIPGPVRRRNLTQFVYRQVYWFRYRWTRLFLESYYAAAGRGEAARRRESARVLRKARARIGRARLGPGRQFPQRC
jgi:tRNA A-37 threonylcarbamoyl transferase component Bud32